MVKLSARFAASAAELLKMAAARAAKENRVFFIAFLLVCITALPGRSLTFVHDTA
jgi:hypothetical protein